MLVLQPDELKSTVTKWKKDGNKIVFTNGVFDLLHIGHVTYLQKARELGDRLVVGINDDDSVRKLDKGPERPINPQDARAAVVAALRCVDAVIIFGEDTPIRIIESIIPDVLVKGGDYDPAITDRTSKKYIVGSDIVKQHGGSVIAIDLVQGFSTTAIASRIKKQS